MRLTLVVPELIWPEPEDRDALADLACPALETLLAQAREQDVQAKLNLYLAKALLERVSGIERLEALQETPAQPLDTRTR